MASTYLTRTPSSTTNRKTYTISTWFKRSAVSGANQKIFEAGVDGSSYTNLIIRNTERLQFYSEHAGIAKISITSQAQLRDTNGWYHAMVAVDTTQATASNRVKLYINGEQVTVFETETYGDQNLDTYVNYSSANNVLGRRSAYGDFYFDGLMSYVALVDGTAELPTIFGETDSVTGEWKIKTSITPSSAWGTNGFLILKYGNSLTDESTNTNNFTLGAGTLTKTEDSPSNVFATFNPLIINNFVLPNMIYVATSEGNNTLTGTASTNNGNCYSTLGASSGKFYCEIKKIGSSTGYPYIGIMPEEGLSPTSSSIYGLVGYNFTDTVSYEPSGNKRINGSSSSYGNTYGQNDIIGIAMDLDNGAIYFSKNGTFQNSGNPASGSSKTGAALTFTPNDKNYFFGASTYNTSEQVKVNFGNGYFGTTTVASAGTNASGIGIFEYDTPTGYTALSTKGLNL